MRLTVNALAAALFVTAASPAVAQVEAEANLAHAEGKWGGEVGVGYTVIGSKGVRVTPAVGVFLGGGDNDRYYLDAQETDPVCFDRDSGLPASRDKCDDTAILPFGRLEASYTVPLFLTFGAGARFIDGEVRPYGTVAVPLWAAIRLKTNVGPKYIATGIAARF